MEQNRPSGDQANIGETIHRVLRTLVNGRWWIISSVLAAVIITLVGLSLVPKHYKSEATLLIDEQQISQRLVSPLSTESVAQRLDAMTQEILSGQRLLEIIREFGLFSPRAGGPQESSLPQDALLASMRKSIEIEPIDPARAGSFKAVRISFTAATPEVAQAVTQKLCLLFIERNSATQAQRANATASFLTEPLEGKRKRAADLAHQIETFKMQHATELPDGRVSNDARLTEARMQLQNVQSSLSRARQQEIVWESMLAGNVNRLKTERAALMLRFTPKHPEVIKKDAEIEQMAALLNQAKGGGAGGGTDSAHMATADPAVAQLAGQIRASRLEIDTLSADEKHWSAAIAELQGRLYLAPVRDQQLAEMLRQAEALNGEIASLEKLEQQSGLAADMERNQQGQQFRQLDAASLPSKPTGPAKLIISLGALAAGLVLGFAIAFLLDMRSPSFHSEKELRQRFGPPLVISVPALPTPAEKRGRRLRVGFELAAGSVVAMAVLAVEFYVYKHP